MKKEVLVFIFDGYADWESAYVSSELNAPESGYFCFFNKMLCLDRRTALCLSLFRKERARFLGSEFPIIL